jgi:transposase
MARTLPKLGDELVLQIENAWNQTHPDWIRKRLLVVRLIAQHQHTVAGIMRIAGVSRQTVFTYRDKLVGEGLDALLKRSWAGARKPAVDGELAEKFIGELKAGTFRQARDAQKWIEKRTRKKLTEGGVRKLIHRLGGKLKVPRKSHRKKDQAASDAFRAELPQRLSEVVGPAPDKPVRLWVLDEHRYGLLPVIRRVWSLRGVRVHAPYATTYKWGYLHEALEIDGAHDSQLLFTPAINQDIHTIFLEQIAVSDPGSLHVVIADQAGFHLRVGDARIPANIRLLPLPAYCPELNPVEGFGRQLKAPTVNRLYRNLRRLEDHLIAIAKEWTAPERIHTLIHGWMRDQANTGAPS